jgi:hypothetical protein
MNERAFHTNLRLPHKRVMTKNLLPPPQSQQILGEGEQQDQIRTFEDYIQAQLEYQKLIEKCEEDLLYLNQKNINSDYISSWREFIYYCECFNKQFITNVYITHKEIKMNLDYIKEELTKLSILRKYIYIQFKIMHQIEYNKIMIKKLYTISTLQNAEKYELQVQQMNNSRSMVNIPAEDIMECLHQLEIYLHYIDKIKEIIILDNKNSISLYYSNASMMHCLSWKGNISR